MEKVFAEENDVYVLDCRNALWATDSMHIEYEKVGNFLSDVDFVFEDANYLYLVEYKNANIQGAANPGAFEPSRDQKIQKVSRKFYDSLHYLRILKKDKPKKYIYILEYPNGDSSSRRMIRNRIKLLLPFSLQEDDSRLIESVEVLSIDEWNESDTYSRYPLCLKEEFC